MKHHNLKPETLEAIQGNQLTPDNVCLARWIENGTKLHFFFSSENNDFLEGVLIGMGPYNYLIAASSEVVQNKAHICCVRIAP
jgi:hypothetical protein